MPKIAFIGAGSFGFTRSLVRDILTFPLMEGADIALMDIDKERLEAIRRACMRIVDEGGYPAKITATTSRKEALKGADVVIITILQGGLDIWRHDIEIPKRFGVDTCIGDTRGPSGIFRALRTIPVMVDICRDVERLCPNAVVLNYTNPMAMNCRAMQRETSARVSGLCHSVQGTATMLAKWIKAPMDEITYVCAGINHQSWFINYEWRHEDAYPLIRKAVRRARIYNSEIVRNELFLAFGYYVTESSGHNSEYNAWFRKRPDLIEKYCSPRPESAWNPGEYAYIVESYAKRLRTWRRSIRKWLEDPEQLNLKRGHEYAAYIANAWLGGEAFKFNGNLPNTGIITNLPPDCCVEVPVYVDRGGFNAAHVGALPPQCAALTNISVASEEMAVEGCLTGDPTLVYQAICYDPLTSAVLSLAEIKKMVNAMFRKNKDYLPHFKGRMA